MKLSPLPQIIVFIISLILGRFLSIQYATGDTATGIQHAKHPSMNRDQYEQIPADQVNFLIIKVDSLQAEHPNLENLWWVLHKRQGVLNMVSIYPSMSDDENIDTTLQSDFAIEFEGGRYRLARSFEELLKSRNMNWQGYLILDEIAYRGMLGNQPVPTPGNKAPLPNPELATQLLEWKLFCRNNLKSDWQNLAQNSWVWNFDQDHLSFEPSEQGMQTWQGLMSDTSTNSCVFPVLDSRFD